MERILIRKVKVQEIEQAYEGYVNWCDDVVATINFEIGDKAYWLSVYQKDNMPGFYLSQEDIFDRLLHVRQNPELMRYRILFYAGFKLDWYENIYPAIYRLIDSNEAKVIRLICYMARERLSDVQDLIRHIEGKYLNDIYIPTTDIEEMYLSGKLA